MKKILILFLFSFGSKFCFSQLNYIDRLYQGVGGIDGIMRPNSLIVSPDNKNVYVIGNNKTISIFKYNDSINDLEYLECMITGDNNVNGIFGIYQMDFSPDGKYLYGILKDSSSVIVFNRDTANGKLNIIQTIKNSDTKNGLSSATRILVSKNGKFVYTASEESNNIVVFQRNQLNGSLSFVDTVKTYYSGYINGDGYYLTSSYDSKYLYSCSSSDRKLISYQIDSVTAL